MYHFYFDAAFWDAKRFVSLNNSEHNLHVSVVQLSDGNKCAFNHSLLLRLLGCKGMQLLEATSFICLLIILLARQCCHKDASEELQGCKRGKQKYPRVNRKQQRAQDSEFSSIKFGLSISRTSQSFKLFTACWEQNDLWLPERRPALGWKDAAAPPALSSSMGCEDSFCIPETKPIPPASLKPHRSGEGKCFYLPQATSSCSVPSHCHCRFWQGWTPAGLWRSEICKGKLWDLK